MERERRGGDGKTGKRRQGKEAWNCWTLLCFHTSTKSREDSLTTQRIGAKTVMFVSPIYRKIALCILVLFTFCIPSEKANTYVETR